MSRIAFADESGTHANPKCYAIGVVSMAKDRVTAFNAMFLALKKQHGVSHEVCWEDLRSSHGRINLALALLHRILKSSTGRFDVIVVNTAQYKRWSAQRADREQAFYLTYTYLLRYVAKQVRVTTDVFIDDRSDGYPKQNEVIETIGNRMLGQLHATGRLANVTKGRSHEHPGIQAADLLTGAVAASHRLLLDPHTPIHHGKVLAIARMASLLGWDALYYDTFPSDKFNIWHFPKEYRATPASRQVKVSRHVPFVTKEDLIRS